jgi:hypothetical protein
MTDQTTEALAVNLRGTIFADQNKKRASREITFFGARIELRQPTLRDITNMADEASEQAAIVSTLLHYAYVPGTEQKVFTEAHIEALMELPFGPDFTAVADAIRELSASMTKAEAKND